MSGSASTPGSPTRTPARWGGAACSTRYLDEDDGLPGSEGAFGICSFWGVEALALEGDVTAARRDFERLVSFANDVGLSPKRSIRGRALPSGTSRRPLPTWA